MFLYIVAAMTMIIVQFEIFSIAYLEAFSFNSHVPVEEYPGQRIERIDRVNALSDDRKSRVLQQCEQMVRPVQISRVSRVSVRQQDPQSAKNSNAMYAIKMAVFRLSVNRRQSSGCRARGETSHEVDRFCRH